MEESLLELDTTETFDQRWIDELESDKFDKSEDDEVEAPGKDLIPATNQPTVSSASAEAFATGMTSMAARLDVPFHDLQDSEIESVEEHAPPVKELKIDDIIQVPSSYVQEELSDFCLAFGTWCDKEGITRRSYDALREILCMIEAENTFP